MDRVILVCLKVERVKQTVSNQIYNSMAAVLVECHTFYPTASTFFQAPAHFADVLENLLRARFCGVYVR